MHNDYRTDLPEEFKSIAAPTLEDSIHPSGKRLLVRRESIKRESEGGIHLPEGTDNVTTLRRATVIRKGNEVNGEYEPGVTLLLSRYAGDGCIVDSRDPDLVLVSETEVIGHLLSV